MQPAPQPGSSRFGVLAAVAAAGWLFGGIFFYLRGNGNRVDLQTIFLLRDRPGLSAMALLLLVIGLWMYIGGIWRRLLHGAGRAIHHSWKALSALLPRAVERYTSLDLLARRVIGVSLGMYVALFIVAWAFPGLTGYAFRNDWAFLLVVFIPLIALLLLMLADRLRSFKAKFGNVEVEMEQAITAPAARSLTLESRAVEKGLRSELTAVVERASREQPSLLLVPLGGERRVTFIALRQYIHELFRVTPLRYVVFVTHENNEYLGFITAERFVRRYPAYVVEGLLADVAREDDPDVHQVLRAFATGPAEHPAERLEWFQHHVILRQWVSGRERISDTAYLITPHNFTRLGASRDKVQRGSVTRVYKLMVDHDLPGIPVVDDQDRFLGIAEREKVLAEVILQLLDDRERRVRG